MGESAQCTCPTCGTPFTGERPRIDLDANTFICASGWVHLPGIRIEILTILLKAYPGVARHEAIFLGIYGGGEMPEGDPIKVHVSNIRKALRPLGWDVRVVHKRGYRLARLIDGDDGE